MKLCRFGEMGREKPAVVTAAGARRDVSGHVRILTILFFASDGLEKLGQWFRANEEKCPVVPENARWGACIARPSKIVCIGLNYARHAAETGKEVPKEPVIFMKAPSSLCGAVRRPGDSEEFTEDGLGSGTGVGDRKAGFVCFGGAGDGARGRVLPDERLQRAGFSNGTRRPVGEREELRHVCHRWDRFWRRPMRFGTRTNCRWVSA